MKFFFKISLLLSIVLLFSCSKKDDSDDNTSMSILELAIGQWRLESATTINGNLLELEPCDNLQTWTFTNDNRFSGISYSGDNCEISTPFSGFTEEERDFLIISNVAGFSFGIAYNFTETTMNLTFEESEGEEYLYVKI